MAWYHQIWEKLFTFVSDFSKRNTRYVDITKLYLPIGEHLKIFIENFAYSAAEGWNNIANNIRNCDTIGAFKHAYLKWSSVNNFISF